jgi:hypothetical protein
MTPNSLAKIKDSRGLPAPRQRGQVTKKGKKQDLTPEGLTRGDGE